MFSKISEQICWSEKLPASVNFSFPCTSMATFRSQHDAIQPRIGNHCLPQAPPKSWVQRNPFLIRQCHNGYRGGYALLKWLIRTAIWFEHSPFQKAETSNLPKLVNLTNETHSDSFHFTRTAIENKKSWTNTTCIQKRKNYPGEKHVKALLLPSTFGLPRWYQKHSKTFKRTWILWILESLLLFERNYLFQSLRLAPHLFTLISIPDFVVTFGLNQHPLPADFFLFQDIAAAQHRKECRQTVC